MEDKKLSQMPLHPQQNGSQPSTLLMSIGTRGDIEPFLALAEILQKQNWEITCLFPEQFRETVEEAGHHFLGFDKRFLEILESEDGKAVMGGVGSFWQKIRAIQRMSKSMTALQHQMIEQQHRAVFSLNPDRVIYHPKCIYPMLWSYANPKKSILFTPLPLVANAVDFSTTLGVRGPKNFGKIINRFSFWLTNTVTSIVAYFYTKKYHQFYPNQQFPMASLKKIALKEAQVFHGFSPSLFPRPDYWPSKAEVIGFFERNKTSNWQPEPRLSEFLEKYSKIVFITFGSISNDNPKEKTRIIIDTLKKHQIPAIINTSWGGLEKPENYPNHIFFVEQIPYDWIFEKMYAAVIHGGTGTTHSALKYGCPVLIIPHIVDQYFWNKRIAELKLGPKGNPIFKLNSIDFEQQILDLMNSENYKKNVQRLAKEMKKEADREKLFQLILT